MQLLSRLLVEVIGELVVDTVQGVALSLLLKDDFLVGLHLMGPALLAVHVVWEIHHFLHFMGAADLATAVSGL